MNDPNIHPSIRDFLIKRGFVSDRRDDRVWLHRVVIGDKGHDLCVSFDGAWEKDFTPTGYHMWIIGVPRRAYIKIRGKHKCIALFDHAVKAAIECAALTLDQNKTNTYERVAKMLLAGDDVDYFTIKNNEDNTHSRYPQPTQPCGQNFEG